MHVHDNLQKGEYVIEEGKEEGSLLWRICEKVWIPNRDRGNLNDKILQYLWDTLYCQ